MSHLTHLEATQLVEMLTPLVREKLEGIVEQFPQLSVTEQVKLARVRAMELKNLSTAEMLLVWEAYSIIGSVTTLT